jgi:DNA-binding GntR family transcriptional regulator
MTRAPYLALPEQPVALAAGSLPDLVALRLREAILAGAIPAEALLRQEDVAQRFGVSRPPVREALRQLEAEGLVVSRPRRGYVVAGLDPADVAEIFDIRGALEAQAATHAAQRRTDADLAAMEALCAAMEALTLDEPEDGLRFADLNRDFHARICAAGGRPWAGKILRNLAQHADRYVRLGSALVGNIDRVNGEHRMMLEACRARDAETMAQLAGDHVRETGRRLLQELHQLANGVDGGAFRAAE